MVEITDSSLACHYKVRRSDKGVQILQKKYVYFLYY